MLLERSFKRDFKKSKKKVIDPLSSCLTQKLVHAKTIVHGAVSATWKNFEPSVMSIPI